MDRATVKVPLIDLAEQYRRLQPAINTAISCVLQSGSYTMGPEVEAFEREWAEYCGAKYCVGVSSGSDAIYLAIRALWHMSHESFVVQAPAFTFIGTVEPVCRARYVVQLADVDRYALMLPPEREDAVSMQVYRKVLLPVHLYGRPVSWIETAMDRGYTVVEDMAQAHGQKLRGTVGCFSFYPTKNLGAVGQAGAVVTNDESIATIVRQLRVHGEGEVRFLHEKASGNYRMDEIQAAILRAKLPYLNEWNQARRKIADMYRFYLSNIPWFHVPEDTPGHNYHIFALRVWQGKRLDLAQFLQTRGIETAVRYPYAVHQQPIWWCEETGGALVHGRYGDLRESENWAAETLSLPIYPEMTDENVEYVCGAVLDWAETESKPGQRT